MKHNPEVLLRLALHFKDDQHVKILVCSEGLGADWLQQKKKEIVLPNLILLGFQPMEKFSQVLAAGDVLIAILEPDAGVFSVPSKVLSYLCAERPLLLSIPIENLAAKVVDENRAGLLVQPNDTDSLIKKADELYQNQSLCLSLAKNARKYAENNFDIEKIADKFELLLES
jgi:glycosyltransferase involved in cell wall biosynthesis